ncbi:ABC transporter ATP-binding protein [uncultured Allofournierella sp.]|uniref:ABC transporter ATP-binding protein n=1 Tax=uncultured Allofournierella sp. TaxID=1940258 RepID=UPI0037506EC9
MEHLTKRYSGHTAVEDISFQVPEGTICGLLGPNGAGKSTTMNVLTGYISASEGKVSIAGWDILEQPAKAKACVGYLPEQPPLYLDMTPAEYLDFAAELKDVARKERSQQVAQVMERTGLVEFQHRLIKQLSKGYRQRVGLAAALLGNPKVIILDEPTVGLDPAQVIEIRSLIRELGREHTVILSSHILSEVSALCDHVLIIAKGKLLAQGTPEELARQLEAKTQLRVTALGQAQPVQQALQCLEGVESIQILEQKGDEVTVELQVAQGLDLRAAVSENLAKAGCPVLGLVVDTMSLEDVFLQLTEQQEPEQQEAEQQELDACPQEDSQLEQPGEQEEDQ